MNGNVATFISEVNQTIKNLKRYSVAKDYEQIKINK
jgi:hypothetical protein